MADGERHAIRNTTDHPVELAVVVNNRLAQFFQEAGAAGILNEPPSPPTPEKIERFLAVAERYGYWIATPEGACSNDGLIVEVMPKSVMAQACSNDGHR